MQAENALEFEDLRRLVGRYVRSPMGQAELQSVTPLTDREAIENLLVRHQSRLLQGGMQGLR